MGILGGGNSFMSKRIKKNAETTNNYESYKIEIQNLLPITL